MNFSFIFGRYLAIESIMHHLDPRIKLLSALSIIVVAFISNNALSLTLLAAALFAFFGLAHINPLQAIKSILPLSFIVIITALINLFYTTSGDVIWAFQAIQITSGGIYQALFVSLRLTILLLTGSLLTMTTTTFDLTEAIEMLLSPLKKIHVPISEFAFVVGLGLRFLPQFLDEFRTIKIAQTMRGALLTTSPTRKGIANLSSFIIPLFTSVFRHADIMSNSMEARCYQGSQKRSRLRPLRPRRIDYTSLIVLLLINTLVLTVPLFL